MVYCEEVSGMKRIWVTLALMLLSVLIISGCSQPAPSPAASTSPSAKPVAAATAKPFGGLEFLRVADSSAGDPAMQFWTMYCSYWSQIPGITASPFAASMGTQIFMISEGSAEAGALYGSDLILNKDVKNLPQGKTKPVTNVLPIWTQTSMLGAVYVRNDSKIKTYEDLKTANIGGIPAKVGPGGACLAYLDALGITPQNIGQFGGKISIMTTAACQDGLRWDT
jgi:hypothetical protein